MTHQRTILQQDQTPFLPNTRNFTLLIDTFFNGEGYVKEEDNTRGA